MSLETLFSLSQNNQQQILNTSLHNEIDNLVIELRKLVDRQPKPEIFIKSNNNNLSSNVADGVLILNSIPVPALHRGVIKDFNVNFTTVAGTVRVVILNSDFTIRTDVLRGINASTNGTGETVLDEGEMLAVVGQSAGAGVFSAFFTGQIQRVK